MNVKGGDNMNFEEYITHAGVKGMKWGVRKDRKSGSTGSGQNGNKEPGRIKQTWNSLKRERDWSKTYKNVDNMSLSEMRKITQRIQLENDFKRLAKTKKVGNKDDKATYRNRDKLSDKDLLDRVNLLRAKDNFNRQVNEASKEQRELAQRFIFTASKVGIKYATTGTISTKDIGLAAMTKPPNSSETRKKAMKNIIEKYDYNLVGGNND